MSFSSRTGGEIVAGLIYRPWTVGEGGRYEFQGLGFGERGDLCEVQGPGLGERWWCMPV